MAEEKKKPDLKARLNRTVAGNPPPPGPAAPPVMAPPSPEFAPPVAAPPPGLDLPEMAIPQAHAGGAPIPGADIAVPDFIKAQMAERAAAEARAAQERAAAERAAVEEARRRAAAADPFSTSAVAAPSVQDIRLVIDDKAVSDAEVGKRNTGTIVGYVATGVLAIIGGYLLGDFRASKSEESKTVAAMTDIRRQVDATGSAVATLKDKVEHAAAAAGIQSGDEQPGAQPTAPAQATIDMELVNWFKQQSPDPPLSPDVYAGRVGRLRPDLVAKLMKVQLQVSQAWSDLRRHQEVTERNQAVITNALGEAQRARTEYQHMMVVFARGPQGGPPVMGTLVTTTEGPNGYVITPAIGQATRTFYETGDLSTEAILGRVGVPVTTQGAAATTLRGLAQPWADYVARVRSLKSLVDSLSTDQRSLSDALNRGAGGG